MLLILGVGQRCMQNMPCVIASHVDFTNTNIPCRIASQANFTNMIIVSLQWYVVHLYRKQNIKALLGDINDLEGSALISGSFVRL